MKEFERRGGARLCRPLDPRVLRATVLGAAGGINVMSFLCGKQVCIPVGPLWWPPLDVRTRGSGPRRYLPQRGLP